MWARTPCSNVVITTSNIYCMRVTDEATSLDSRTVQKTLVSNWLTRKTRVCLSWCLGQVCWTTSMRAVCPTISTPSDWRRTTWLAMNPYSGPRLAVIIDVKCSNAPWGHGSRQSWTRLMSVPTVPWERRQSLSLRFTMHYNMTLCNSAVCPSRSVHVLPVVLLIISVHSCQRLCRLWNFNCASLCNVFS